MPKHTFRKSVVACLSRVSDDEKCNDHTVAVWQATAWVIVVQKKHAQSWPIVKANIPELHSVLSLHLQVALNYSKFRRIGLFQVRKKIVDDSGLWSLWIIVSITSADGVKWSTKPKLIDSNNRGVMQIKTEQPSKSRQQPLVQVHNDNKKELPINGSELLYRNRDNFFCIYSASICISSSGPVMGRHALAWRYWLRASSCALEARAKVVIHVVLVAFVAILIITVIVITSRTTMMASRTKQLL